LPRGFVGGWFCGLGRGFVGAPPPVKFFIVAGPVFQKKAAKKKKKSKNSSKGRRKGNSIKKSKEFRQINFKRRVSKKKPWPPML